MKRTFIIKPLNGHNLATVYQLPDARVQQGALEDLIKDKLKDHSYHTVQVWEVTDVVSEVYGLGLERVPA